MLKIVCCYAPGGLRDETREALGETIDGATIHYIRLISERDDAYGRVLQREWNWCAGEGSALAVVEQDIVVRPDVIDAFLTHPADYICFPYPWLTDVGPALGCVRFSAAFIQRYPTLLDEAVATGVTWRQLDVVIMRQLLARKYGEQPTVLLPPVEHLNEAKALLPDASPEPLMEVPHW